MRLLQERFYTLLGNIAQDDSSRNRAALECLRALGFSDARIRKAFVTLGDVSIPTLVANLGTNSALFSRVIKSDKGKLRNAPISDKAKCRFAAALGIGVSELWPEEGNGDGQNGDLRPQAA